MPGKRGWCGAMTMWIAGGTAALCGICHSVNVFDGSLTARIIHATVWFCIGFCISGAQSLCTLMSAEFGSKKAVATAAGFTCIPGYLGSFAGGIGIAALSKNFG